MLNIAYVISGVQLFVLCEVLLLVACGVGSEASERCVGGLYCL